MQSIFHDLRDILATAAIEMDIDGIVYTLWNLNTSMEKIGQSAFLGGKSTISMAIFDSIL